MFVYFQARQEQEYAERRAFIASQPLFETWNAKYKRLLEMSIRKQTLGFGDVIVQQGKPVIGLHFIVKYVICEDAFHSYPFS